MTLCFLSQGQRGRLRNRLHRTGQHGVAHIRYPQTNRAIDWYFALGGTNGPGPVGPNRHCPVQSHCCCSTSTELDYETIRTAWNSLSSFFVQSDLKSLTFCMTHYFWVQKSFFFKGWPWFSIEVAQNHEMWWKHVLSVLPLLVLLTGACT